MKRYNLLTVLLLFIFNVTSAQMSSVFGSVTEAKSKIEGTVPVILEHLKKISDSQGNTTVLDNGKVALKNEYNKVSQEFDLYKGNMARCILGKSKKATKCMNYHTQYFRNTLGIYENYITYLTKKNGYLGVADESIKLDFKPTEIATKIDKDFMGALGAVKKMKGNNKSTYFDQLNSEDYKLQNFDTLVN
ncbi:hypothetical protein CHRY9390_02699 [Chryseobacterium aquaeductus]|uniref:Uncharacterized protein n=1 Tax=Chryseobacterium aquaeductus TaxID=2675056 RepID=A0A9N8QVL3_9FLAO|nr:hypothetical protein [Chryseobacterium aquaeductus]CAA7331978.1 hypothetical protein CHRY9390_02699 [Chryseobacterium potabilaquae]CAD7813711.1 hypothetical protein CHRY9390_02699 [Chryseobacterium aquaeductus]